MDLECLIADDYKLFDGTVKVKLTFRRAGAEPKETVCYALREPVRIRESGGEWLLSSSETFWGIGVNELEQAPREGDVLEECDCTNGESWVVNDVEHSVLKTRYRLRCSKQV